MYFCYNKLWKILIDRGMKKQELSRISNVSSTSLAKLAKGENVTTDILLRICKALDVELNDIVETVRKDVPAEEIKR
ncbi:MAG: helix-turn-helix domain-containing protein [Fastidiosipilaceae bacterium]|jgi:DNA-binding Xre family transcriptional regulator